MVLARLAAPFGVLLLAMPLAAQQSPSPAAAHAASGLITGVVVDASTSQPIPGALVSLATTRSAPGTQTPSFTAKQVLTSADGRFMFAGLPAATFVANARKAGFSQGALLTDNATTIELGDGQRVLRVRIALERSAAISGTVLDDKGEPVVGVSVVALRRTSVQGRDEWRSSGPTITTDDRGQYRAGGLTPGDFIVGIDTVNASVPTSVVDAYYRTSNAQQSPADNPMFNELFKAGASGATNSGRVKNGQSIALSRGTVQSREDASGHWMVFPQTFYPAAASASKATIVSIKPGEERAAIDLALHSVPSVTVSGRLMSVSGPLALTAVTLAPLDGSNNRGIPGVIGTVTDASGAFEFMSVPAGDYILRSSRIPDSEQARSVTNSIQHGDGSVTTTTSVMFDSSMPLPPDPALWVEQRISVGEKDVSDLNLSARRGATISGRVVFSGSSARPSADALAKTRVSLVTTTYTSLMATPAMRVDNVGAITSQGFSSGPYYAQATPPEGFGSTWQLDSFTINGVDASQHAIEITGADLDNVIVTFTDRPAQLSGTVTDDTNAAADRVGVFVFPADEAVTPGTPINLRRVTRTVTSVSGQFQFNNLPSGDYYVIALAESGAALPLNAATVQRLQPKATRVSIGVGEKRSQSLRSIKVQ